MEINAAASQDVNQEKVNDLYLKRLTEFIQDKNGEEVILDKISSDIPKIIFHLKHYESNRRQDQLEITLSKDEKTIRIGRKKHINFIQVEMDFNSKT